MRLADGALPPEEYSRGWHLPWLSLLHLLQRHVYASFHDSGVCDSKHSAAEVLPLGRRPGRRHGAQVSTVHPVFAPQQNRLRVTAVIVLFRMKAEESPAFQSIMAARAEIGPDRGDVSVMLWDNSPTPDVGPILPEGVRYFADENNSGLATAYNQ